MSELRDVLDALRDANRRGERCALATLVSVEGSAYRRPGARMLVTEAGAIVGALSGGCLERDIAERAGSVIDAGEPGLVRYDTAARDDIVWGLGLGCDGVVRILIEPTETEEFRRAEAFLRECSAARRRGVMATVFRVEGATGTRPGARTMLHPDGEPSGRVISPQLSDDLRRAMADGATRTRCYDVGGGTVEMLVEAIEPPIELTVFGAGHDAVPLARLARGVGWHVTIVDTKARPSSRERFACADEVVLCRPEEAGARVRVTERTMAVVMTHDYLHDRELLGFLIESDARYIGILGARRRAERMLSELRDAGEAYCSADESARRLHAPVGLDTGAETPEEIAVSIIAEVRAASSGRHGGFLRDRLAPIHDGHDRAGLTAAFAAPRSTIALSAVCAPGRDPA